MKKVYIFLAAVLVYTGSFAQSDSAYVPKKGDTIRIGNIIIIKRGKKSRSSAEISIGGSSIKKKNSKVSTNWGILDIGFANRAMHLAGGSGIAATHASIIKYAR